MTCVSCSSLWRPRGRGGTSSPSLQLGGHVSADWSRSHGCLLQTEHMSKVMPWLITSVFKHVCYPCLITFFIVCVGVWVVVCVCVFATSVHRLSKGKWDTRQEKNSRQGKIQIGNAHSKLLWSNYYFDPFWNRFDSFEVVMCSSCPSPEVDHISVRNTIFQHPCFLQPSNHTIPKQLVISSRTSTLWWLWFSGREFEARGSIPPSTSLWITVIASAKLII